MIAVAVVTVVTVVIGLLLAVAARSLARLADALEEGE